ncbi:GIY-YIG nuclease family protein [Pedobacter sp. SD-b]|uniref:GIY-YIG nuclease family protein n=1 Tax=Pedobacter segetis TaxID=2793069 RepID=A0ABS1BKS2_9SPHI|nr:GIY-YIG nuclease family protein [Pedobacter segetis]MBK0383494.1 GIY-YIG nuclease family protein [Pedobacter segetis]
MKKVETKRFVFIVTDRNRNNLHVGLSSNIIKTMDFYRLMPNLFFDAGKQLTNLVYFEELSTETAAEIRFKIINRFTRAQKEKIVRSVNSDWIDLTNALKYDGINKRVAFAQPLLSFAS